MNIKIKAIRDLIEEPVLCNTVVDISEIVNSVVDSEGNIYPAQRCGGEGIVVIASMKRAEEKKFTICDKVCPLGTEIRQGENKLDVYIKGKLFTSYVYSPEFVKPFLGEVYNSENESYTRLDFKTKEHPHHRSVFLGVGDVNGIDFWNEPKNCGGQRHVEISKIINGSAFSSFTAKNIWESVDKKPIIDECRTFTFYNQTDKCRYIDLEITFTASYEDITFGATKEAGPLGIRVNELLRADNGSGHMINSYGAVDEEECWGKSAHWCDYFGKLNGNLYGIAVFDNEMNERYPTSWHIRNYGLFAANNLFFKGGLSINKGESLSYKYRICFHGGDFNAADRFVIYVNSKK